VTIYRLIREVIVVDDNGPCRFMEALRKVEYRVIQSIPFNVKPPN
jgi:hypothetical protein